MRIPLAARRVTGGPATRLRLPAPGHGPRRLSELPLRDRLMQAAALDPTSGEYRRFGEPLAWRRMAALDTLGMRLRLRVFAGGRGPTP